MYYFRYYYGGTAELQKLDDNKQLLLISNHLRNCRIAELQNHDNLKYIIFSEFINAELQNCRS